MSLERLNLNASLEFLDLRCILSADFEAHIMQNSMDKEEATASNPISAVDEHVTPGERVFTEPIDDAGIILLETRIAPDGTKRTRKITRKGWLVHTLEDRLKMKAKYPAEPDSAP